MFYLYLALLFTNPANTSEQQRITSEETREYPSEDQCELMGASLSIALQLPPGYKLLYQCIEITGSIEGHPLTPESKEL